MIKGFDKRENGQIYEKLQYIIEAKMRLLE